MPTKDMVVLMPKTSRKASEYAPEERLIWVDIETTGLDYFDDHIIEVGFVVTDLYLNPLDTFHSFIWSEAAKRRFDGAIELVKNMHNSSGLITSCIQDGKQIATVADKLNAWFQEIGVTKNDPLCGSSVQFDRTMLTRDFPESMELMSYRNIDISTVKELCKRYNPLLAKQLDLDVVPMKRHRSHPDIQDTLEEFQFYRDNFLWWKETIV